MIDVIRYPVFQKASRQLKISLCMPIHKPVPQFIRQAVASIDGNGYTNHELVMKDTADNKRRVLEMLEPGIQNNKGWQEVNWNYQFGPDKGIFDGLNQAIAATSGDVLYFMCSDDILLPKALEVVNLVFQHREDEPFWAYGITMCGDENLNSVGQDGSPITYEQLLLRNHIGQPAVFFNRRMWELVGAFDTQYKHSADYDYWLRCWRFRPPAFIDWPLGLFRRTAGQHSTVFREGVDDESTRISNSHIAQYRGDGYEIK